MFHVTAKDKSKGYRVIISKTLQLKEAIEFCNSLKKQLNETVPQYVWCEDLKIEKETILN